MAIYEVRAVSIATENAWTELSENGRSGTAVRTVPAGITKLKQLWIVWAPGATAGVANLGVRLQGNGIAVPGYIEEFAGPSTAPGGTNTQNLVIPPTILDVDIPVSVGAEISVQASVNGADVGTGECAVTLVYA